MNADAIDTLCINTIRTLSIDAIQKADSGHPGLPLGASPMAYVLWQYHLRHSPQNPSWVNRDRFILSAGHGSMLLYSLMHLTGYSDVTLDEIKRFRQWGSKTPGHPEFGHTRGVEATTGPLGQGASNAVGMAMAERSLANLFNRPGFELINHFTYALVSDGDLMEGVAAEAGSLAGHLKLGKLIYLYDANDVTLDGPTTLTFSAEDVAKRYESYGWQVQWVRNGDQDLKAIHSAIESAKKESHRPSLILVKTTIGFGSEKAGTSSVHGAPLNAEEIKRTKKNLGWFSEEPFQIPQEARAHFETRASWGKNLAQQWDELFAQYEKAHPELAKQWKLAFSKELPTGWKDGLPEFKLGEDQATRQASGKVLNALAKKIPWFLGGDADLSCSTNTALKDLGSFDGTTGAGRNIHYGVREHAMAAIANGMDYHGGVRNFVSTFFCFADYMRPSIRLAAMNHLAPIYVWTHDSFCVGEDGPTHQPIEQLMSLRSMPGMTVIRPADPNETREAWKLALENTKGPTGIVLTRQKLPVIDRTRFSSESGVQNGAYVLTPSNGSAPQVILIATGSEVSLSLAVWENLEKQGVKARVVSMPSWEIFSRQPESYRNNVLPPEVRSRVSLEAGVTFGWERWVGDQGLTIGIDHYGASAPQGVLLEKFGFTAAQVTERVLQYLKKT